MATISSTQVGNSYCPQMILTYSASNTDTQTAITYSLQYKTYGYTISSSVAHNIAVGITLGSGSTNWRYDVDWTVGGKTTQNLFTNRTVTFNRTKTAQTAKVRLYWDMEGVTWSGSGMGLTDKTANVTVPALASYTVSYNANGGSGAPSSQTKWYGESLTLSSSVPSRADYNFVGWATSSTATTADYQPGGSYTANGAATLYAVWELAYVPPTIADLAAIRCTSAGVQDDSGTFAKVTFGWSVDTSIHTDNVLQSISIAYSEHGAGAWTSSTVAASGLSGTVSQIIGTFDASKSYDMRATVTDSYGSTSMFVILSQAFFTLDVLAGGHGIAFGMAAQAANADTFANGYKNLLLQGETKTYSGTLDDFISLLAPVDYVVEESHGSTSSYRKWSSGKLECWVRQSITTTINTTWGGTYRNTPVVTGTSWPVAFARLDHCYTTNTGQNGDMAWVACASTATESKAPDFYLLRGAALTSSKQFTVHHYGVGTWK